MYSGPMTIPSSLPMNIARAYGLVPTQPISRPTPVGPRPLAPSVVPPRQRADVASITAGAVAGPVDFSPSASPAGPGFQLYTRAADKVEAAVAVHVGSTLDVRG